MDGQAPSAQPARQTHGDLRNARRFLAARGSSRVTARLSYRELAPPLADYLEQLGYTHVEFLPVMDHPFFGSWGYQITGYFAPSGNYGTPQDLMYLIDYSAPARHRRDPRLGAVTLSQR